MKNRIFTNKQIFLVIILIICYQFEAASQDSNAGQEKKTGFYIGLSLGPSQSQVIQTLPKSTQTFSGENFRSAKKISFSGIFELGYSLSKNFAISTGLGFRTYGTELSLDSCRNIFNDTDSENEVFEKRVTGWGINEVQTISSIYLPVCVNLNLPIGSKFGFFIQAGVNISMPITKTYSSKGTYSYTAYYATYNVLLQDLPAYGLDSNAPVTYNGNLNLKAIGVDATGSAGFQYLITSKLQIALGVNYNRSLSGISNYTSPENFQISPNVNLINSIMGGSKTVATQNVGLMLSLRYYFR